MNSKLKNSLKSLLDRMVQDPRTAAMFEADGDTLREAITACDQLTAALAELDEAREKWAAAEDRITIEAECCNRERARADRLAAQLDTARQQGAEAFRESAVNVCYERAQNQGSNQCQYAADDIRALPAPPRP